MPSRSEVSQPGAPATVGSRFLMFLVTIFTIPLFGLLLFLFLFSSPHINITRLGFDTFPYPDFQGGRTYTFKNTITTEVVICIGKDGKCHDPSNCPSPLPPELCGGLILRPGEERQVLFDFSQEKDLDYWVTVKARDGSIIFESDNLEVRISRSQPDGV